MALSIAGCSGGDPLPPLASGLPADVATAETRFDARVRQRYPVGSSESALLTDVRRQGFTVSSAPDGLHMADLYQPNGCGRTLWSVRWQADAAHKLTSVFGVYGLQCL